jgi:hypothetical protein
MSGGRASSWPSSRHCSTSLRSSGRCLSWVASVLEVLTLDGDHIAEVTGFVTAELLSRWGEEDDRFVGATAFPRFGLPDVLPG